MDMKRNLIVCALVVASLQLARAEDTAKPAAPAAAASADKDAPHWPALKTEKDKISYAIGEQMGGYYLMHRELLDEDRMVQGFRDAFNVRKPMLDGNEAQEMMSEFEKKVRKLEEDAKEQERVDNRRDGEKFLDANKKKDGVKTLASGLEYKVVKEGKADGSKPGIESRVHFHYKVKDINGDLLDESYHLSKPVAANMRNLIKGWQEGLQLMKEGAVYEFYIPSGLAYGEGGAGRNIKSNMALVTEIELESVEK